MINFSIIIPHYNSPTLLQRCLASIPDCEDIQVIVVDDCSDPKIVDFDTLPGRERQFTEVYRTPKGGSAGRARNVGLEHAKGKWLLFADADDYFEPNAFDIFIQHINDTEDMLYFDTCSRFTDTNEPSDRNYHTTRLLQQYLTTHNDAHLRYYYFVPWSRMIRHVFVQKHNIRFDEIRWANDVMFAIQCGYYATNINAHKDIVYCITVSKGSLMMQHTEESLRTRYIVQLQRNLFLREHGIAQYELSIMSYLRQAFHYGLRKLFDYIKIGKQYHTHFFVGASRWGKNAFIVMAHALRKDPKKTYYTHS